MRKLYFSFLFLFAFGLAGLTQVNHLVISQVYGGGGNTGATYNRDYVELFNPTNAAINLSGYTLQYASAAGTTWSAKALTGSVAPYSYFLIQTTTSGVNGAPILTPDFTLASATDMAGAAGKLALVNGTIPLTGSCPTDPSIVDFVGYGTTASCFEGTGPTPAPSVTNSIFRAAGGCTDANNNASDFTAAAASPRNSSSPQNVCAATTSITTGVVSTTPFCVTTSTVATGTVAFSATGTFNTSFTAWLSDASGSFAAATSIGSTTVNGTDPSGTINITIPSGTASGTGYRIRVDANSPATTGTITSTFEIINGANNVTGVSANAGQTSANISWTNPTGCYDEIMVVVKQGSSISATPAGDGTAYTADANFSGSGTAFDGGKVVYEGTGTNVNVTGLTTGGNYYVKVFTRIGTTWSSGVEINIASLGVLNHLVISQVYGGGGNTNASYTNDFVEIFNPTSSTINLTGYSIQYASAAGTTWIKIDLSGSIAPYSYYLLQLSSGGAVGNALPTPDATGALNLSGTNGKLALVNSTVALTGSCPVGSPVVDFVGYGTANCFEGSAAAPAPSDNQTALFRGNGGCTDTDNNNTDFATGAAAPRNSASAPNNCATSGAPLPVHFTNFKATQRTTGIQLEWTNETEENVAVYEIERSSNGRTFTTIAEKAALKNDNSKVSYAYLDAAPVNGDNFYRIRAVELDGKTVYTSIVRINPSARINHLVLYPNPVRGHEMNLQISNLAEGQYRIRVYNTTGQEVMSKTISHAGGAITESLYVGKLGKGIYSLQLSGSQVMQHQFIIE